METPFHEEIPIFNIILEGPNSVEKQSLLAAMECQEYSPDLTPSRFSHTEATDVVVQTYKGLVKLRVECRNKSECEEMGQTESLNKGVKAIVILYAVNDKSTFVDIPDRCNIGIESMNYPESVFLAIVGTKDD
jgi:hypothetical protein